MKLRLLKILMKEQLFPALAAFVVALIALIVSCLVIAGNTAIEHRIQIWIYGCGPLDFFLPLLASLPFSFTLYYKKSDGFLHYSGTRMSRKRYVAYHMAAGFLLCVAGIAIVYFCGLLFSEYIIPFETTSGYHSRLESYVFGELMVSQPVFFGFGWCLWKGFNAGLFTLFGYGLALYAENVFIASVAPFVYFVAENLITSLLQISEYSIVTSIQLNRLSPDSMHIYNYFAGTISFVIIATVIVLALNRREKNRYEVKAHNKQIIEKG
ncbi:MAG: hypothetical protein LUF29_05965 [Oscillospiraceae bacterium]|nr:hypothetical protein [Oscillospiraceae bacterium]